jgi:DNA-binding NarL/FixJ family response regulator
MEATTNIARHAHARRAELQLDADAGALRLVIRDDGVGIPPGSPRAGLGVRSMLQRARQVGGRCDIEAAGGAGNAGNRDAAAAEVEMTVRVLIADDHPVFRHGLRSALSGVDDIEVVGEATDGRSVVTAAVERAADVVLMDLHMPGATGIEAIRELSRVAPAVCSLVLTMLDNDESLFTAIRAGARGYLVKGADQEQIVRAIRAVVVGDVVFGAGIAERALGYFAAAPAGSRAARPFPELSDREVEILQLLAGGASNADMARRLYLSEKTVRNHVSNVFAKLRVAGRPQAIVRAREAGLGSSPTSPWR